MRLAMLSSYYKGPLIVWNYNHPHVDRLFPRLRSLVSIRADADSEGLVRNPLMGHSCGLVSAQSQGLGLTVDPV